MGVGLPFGIGAQAARPDQKVLVLHGDGSFGINAINLDTAVRHQLPVVTVVNVNGGWTATPEGRPTKPWIFIGSEQRYDRLGEALGTHGEYVDKPAQLRPALERAFASREARRHQRRNGSARSVDHAILRRLCRLGIGTCPVTVGGAD